MARPRIILGTLRHTPRRLLTVPGARYVAAGLALAVQSAIVWMLGPSLDTDSFLLLMFSVILLVSTTVGFGPGVLATGLAIFVGNYAPTNAVGAQDLRLLAIQGLLVSLIGGILRSARIKAADRLAANMRLEQQIMEISDDERRRIGRDLHDGLGQHLTGISLLSESMSQQLASGQRPNPANVETITRLVSEAVGLTRDLARSLSPVTLERDGFIAAMEELAETSSSLFGIDCRWEFEGGDLDLEQTRALHLYRIVQEAVNNSVCHGNARNVRIELMCEPNDAFIIQVTDDGSGLSQKTTDNPGLGLQIMQDRARMLGASLDIERAAPEGGTVVTCRCPVKKGPDGSQ